MSSKSEKDQLIWAIAQHRTVMEEWEELSLDDLLTDRDRLIATIDMGAKLVVYGNGLSRLARKYMISKGDL